MSFLLEELAEDLVAYLIALVLRALHHEALASHVAILKQRLAQTTKVQSGNQFVKR
jgi:hypothetical protein